MGSPVKDVLSNYEVDRILAAAPVRMYRRYVCVQSANRREKVGAGVLWAVAVVSEDER